MYLIGFYCTFTSENIIRKRVILKKKESGSGLAELLDLEQMSRQRSKENFPRVDRVFSLKSGHSLYIEIKILLDPTQFLSVSWTFRVILPMPGWDQNCPLNLISWQTFTIYKASAEITFMVGSKNDFL